MMIRASYGDALQGGGMVFRGSMRIAVACSLVTEAFSNGR